MSDKKWTNATVKIDDILIYNDAISRGFNNLNYISICLKSKFAPFQE